MSSVFFNYLKNNFCKGRERKELEKVVFFIILVIDIRVNCEEDFLIS